MISPNEYLKKPIVDNRPTYEFEFSDKKIRMVDLNSRLVLPAVCKSLYTGMKFAISMGFTHCHSMVGDVIFDMSDHSEINRIQEDVIKNSKYGYFEIVPDNHHFKGIESVYWFCDCRWFLDTFLCNFSYENILNSISSDFYFELFIYNKLIEKKSEVFLHFKKEEDPLISFSKSKKSGESVNLGYTKSVISLFYCIFSKTWAIFVNNGFDMNVCNFNIFIKSEKFSNSFEMSVPGFHWAYQYLNTDESDSFNMKILNESKKIIEISFDREMLQNLKSISSVDL